MPASYPTSAKTFTTKSAGDTIQPGHVNDLQDEVAAIEDGLLNGTAPLNSSNSTVANLVVSGLSTFAGDVAINSTLTVTKIVSTSITTRNAESYVRAFADAVWEFSTVSTGTKIAFNNRVADLSSEYDSTTFTFTPKSSGYYQISARMKANGGVAGDCQIQVWVNDTLAVVGGDLGQAGAVYVWPQVNGLLNLSSGAAGAITIRAKYSESTSRISTGLGITSFEILKLF